MSPRTKAFLAIVVVSLLWSTAGIVGKILLKTFDPFTLAFLRYFIASIIVLPFFLKQKHGSVKKMLIDVIPIALLSSLNVALFYIGLPKTTVNATAVMYAATPLIVATIAYLTIHERLTKMKILGIIVGFIGVLTFLLFPALGRGEIAFGSVTGNLIMLLGVCSWAAFNVGSRFLTTTKQYSPFQVSAISMFVSVPVYLLIMMFSPPVNLFTTLFDFNTIMLLLYLGIFLTVLTYSLFLWAIKHSSSTTSSLTHYLQPIFAFYFAYIFLGETITSNFLLGSLLVLLGVFLATGTRLMQELRKILGRI